MASRQMAGPIPWLADERAAYLADYIDPFARPENALHFLPRPGLAKRTVMRLAERFGPFGVGFRCKMARYDWSRPYMRTGGVWWRPVYLKHALIEMTDENGQLITRNLLEPDIRPYFRPSVYTAVVYRHYATPHGLRKWWLGVTGRLEQAGPLVVDDDFSDAARAQEKIDAFEKTSGRRRW